MVWPPKICDADDFFDVARSNFTFQMMIFSEALEVFLFKFGVPFLVAVSTCMWDHVGPHDF